MSSFSEYQDISYFQSSRPIPTFNITRAPDMTLQWDPPLKSKELADALSYHYPLEETLQKKMQQASLDFFLGEEERSFPISKNSAQSASSSKMSYLPLNSPPPVNTNSVPTSEQQAIAENLVQYQCPYPGLHGSVNPAWDLNTGIPVKTKGRHGPLTPEQRRRAANNRGNACDYHKRTKTACDPDTCLGNRLNNRSSSIAGMTGESTEIVRGNLLRLNPVPPMHYVSSRGYEMPYSDNFGISSIGSLFSDPSPPTWRNAPGDLGVGFLDIPHDSYWPLGCPVDTGADEQRPDRIGMDLQHPLLYDKNSAQTQSTTAIPVPEMAVCTSSDDQQEPKRKRCRSRFSGERRMEVARVRKVGACARCRSMKVRMTMNNILTIYFEASKLLILDPGSSSRKLEEASYCPDFIGD